MDSARSDSAGSPIAARGRFAGFTRRDVLRVGSVSVAASALPGLTLGAPDSPRPTRTAARADSVIYLWMGGGVTHIDSFDPKPEAPQEIRGELTAISTVLPGVQFCETMPQLARIADRLAVVRTFSHDSNDHLLSQVYTLSGRKVGPAELFTHPNIGSIVSHLLGPRNGLPGYIAVPGITRPGPPPHNLFVGGWLGNQYAPFSLGGQPDQPDFTQGPNLADPAVRMDEDLNPKELSFPADITVGRLSRRANLRAQLDEALRGAEQSGLLAGLEGHYDSALHLLTAENLRDAFDVTREPDAVRDAYGRTKIGGRCLTARRLVEAGARYVMVDYGYDPDYGNLWDNHNAPSQNHPHISKMCRRGYHVAGIDKAFAALITDLDERGLLDRTLVVFLTEFGRTPKINDRGGRDHWGACGSLFFTGAGTRVGQVIGESDRQAAYPVTRGYSPADVAATIYHALGLEPETRVYDRENRPVPLLDHGEPIAEVLA
ncbi:MAG TPA: DUF1501 domain-containing protein [Planctomycetaceae bacterium]|nr:DUF1501 domain-containing protein [Planctomycetaceae bacterium]